MFQNGSIVPAWVHMRRTSLLQLLAPLIAHCASIGPQKKRKKTKKKVTDVDTLMLRHIPQTLPPSMFDLTSEPLRAMRDVEQKTVVPFALPAFLDFFAASRERPSVALPVALSTPAPDLRNRTTRIKTKPRVFHSLMELCTMPKKGFDSSVQHVESNRLVETLTKVFKFFVETVQKNEPKSNKYVEWLPLKARQSEFNIGCLQVVCLGA